MTPEKESQIQAKIIKGLRAEFKGAFIWKAAAGPYSRQGIPDILMIYRGRFFGLEVKRPEGGRLSTLQAQSIEAINRAGGTAAVVHSLEEAEAVVKAVFP